MQLNYDATNVTPRSFTPIPTSWQNMQLDSWEEKPTKKDNDDTYAACTFEVIDGEYKGRKLFYNLNVGLESSPQAKTIAFESLAAWMHACGVLKINTLDDLLRKPFSGKVKHVAAVLEEDGSEKYAEKNEIKGFKKIEGAVGASAAPGGGLPEGFTSQAQAAPAAVAASPAAAPASAPAAAPAVPAAAPAPAPKIKVLVMTAKANGMSAEQFRAHDAAWTDALLVQEGYAVIEERDDPAAKPAAPAVPATPATPSTPSTPAPAAAATESSSDASAQGDDDLPPWERG